MVAVHYEVGAVYTCEIGRYAQILIGVVLQDHIIGSTFQGGIVNEAFGVDRAGVSGSHGLTVRRSAGCRGGRCGA